MFNLNTNNHIPINVQLFNEFKKAIIIGVMKENEKLPSVRKISQELMINPNTVHKAYQELEKEELVVTLPQKGVYVNKISDKIKIDYQRDLEQKFKLAYKNLLELSLDKTYIINLIN